MTVNEQRHSEAERAFRAERARESRMARKTLESATGERTAPIPVRRAVARVRQLVLEGVA